MEEWIRAVCENQQEQEKWDMLEDDTKELLEPLKDKLEDYKNSMYFYKEALASLPNAIFMKESDTRYVFFNREYQESFGMDGNSMIGRSVVDLEYLPMEDRLEYQREDKRMIQEKAVVHYEKPFVFSDDKVHETLYWSRGFEVPETKERGLVGEIVDISEEKELRRNLEKTVQLLTEAYEKIERLSVTDGLTGVFNRTVLKKKYDKMQKDCEKKNVPFSAMMLDLDYFKKVNDEFGHLVGDNVLCSFAHLLEHVCCKGEIVVRYGGEEFLVLVPGKNAEEAAELGERFCDKLRKKSFLPNGRQITASVGVAQYRNGETVVELLNRADATLYRAKKEGRDRVRIAE